MKRLLIVGSVMVWSILSLTSCRNETERRTEVREVEVERQTPDTTTEREGALQRAAKKIDEEVNEEIDEEIDKIGDDN